MGGKVTVTVSVDTGGIKEAIAEFEEAVKAYGEAADKLSKRTGLFPRTTIELVSGIMDSAIPVTIEFHQREVEGD